MMRYCFDIDGTICTVVEDLKYEEAQPIQERIDKINALYDEGHEIVLQTARGFQTGCKNTKFILTRQLAEWGVKCHELHLGKANADIYVDDKCMNAELFFHGV
jgi:hypothetical protein